MNIEDYNRVIRVTHNGSEIMYENRNILTVKELEENGFIWTPTAANVHQNKDGTIEPYITVTYLLGIWEEVFYDIPLKLKTQVISRMKELNIKYVMQVYFGEIFIDPNVNIESHWYHIFCRGSKNHDKFK